MKRKIKIEKIDLEKTKEFLGKALYSPYFYLFFGLVIGLLFTVQFKNESSRPLNPTMFFNQIEETKNDYGRKKDDLERQLSEIEKEIDEKERSLAGKNYIPQSILSEVQAQETVLGINNLSGEGLSIVISDGELQIKDEVSKSLTHAADLRDIVNLLWYAGAEAISINDERIIYNTSIDCIVSTILINNNNYVPPFTIKAIGNKQDLYNTINGAKKLEDIKKRAGKKQISFDIKKENEVSINKYSGFISNL